MSSINLKDLFFNFSGQIDRKAFWVGVGGTIAASVVVQVTVLATVNSSDAELVALIASCLFIYPVLAICAKRNRDRGHSIWWLLMLLVPIASLVWMVIDLGLRPGAEEDHNVPSVAVTA